MIQYITDENQKAKICTEILKQLPEWFEIEDAVLRYAAESRQSYFWAYIEGDKAVGFLSAKETSPYAVEISVMGVLESYQRKGIGAAFVKSLYDFAKGSGYEFMQVKTVQAGTYPCYDITNAFYKKAGFKELECIADLWDKDNPCQIYVMHIG